MTFGGDFKRQDRNTTTDQNARGTFRSAESPPARSIRTASRLPNTGFDFADFLLGLPQASSVQFGGDSTYFRQNAWDVYANDDWRVNPNLTLMFGLRYEYYSPLSEKYGHLVNLDIAPGFTAVTPVLSRWAHSGAFPNSLIEPDRDDWAPRGGLAWKPSSKHSTVVRLGYGIYYNPTALNRLATELSEQPPFAVTQTPDHQRGQRADAPKRAGHRAHQCHGVEHLRGPGELQDRLRAKLERECAAEFEPLVFLRAKLPGNQRHRSGYRNRAESRGARIVAADVAEQSANCQRPAVHLRQLLGQFHLSRRAGAADAAFRAQHVVQYPLHLFQVD